MKNIIAFGGSNSKNSINKQLAHFVANQVLDASVTTLDLNDFELPLYGIDLENEQGIPENAQAFLNKIKEADGLVISLAEHNGAYASVFKNIFDWMSRIDQKVWSNIPMLLMATSPGGRGGSGVLQIAASSFPHLGGNIVATFSLPGFNQNFTQEGIIDADLSAALEKEIATFKNAVFSI